jgi:hypothetical protein
MWLAFGAWAMLRLTWDGKGGYEAAPVILRACCCYVARKDFCGGAFRYLLFRNWPYYAYFTACNLTIFLLALLPCPCGGLGSMMPAWVFAMSTIAGGAVLAWDARNGGRLLAWLLSAGPCPGDFETSTSATSDLRAALLPSDGEAGVAPAAAAAPSMKQREIPQRPPAPPPPPAPAAAASPGSAAELDGWSVAVLRSYLARKHVPTAGVLERKELVALAAAAHGGGSSASCAACGAPLTPGDGFCMSCGARVGAGLI